MRNNRHEPNGAKKQRPERIPIDPKHRSYSRNATGAVAIDALLENSRRFEHDYATGRNRRLGAGLRVTAATLTFLAIFCHGCLSLPFQKSPSVEKCTSRHRNASQVHASVYKNVVISQFLDRNDFSSARGTAAPPLKKPQPAPGLLLAIKSVVQ
jgi:hypothetical protein